MEQADAKSHIATPGAASEIVDRLEIFGPPPLLEGEDSKAYDTLLARVSGAVKPKDIIEEIWVRDIVNLTWDTLRLRRLTASCMKATARLGMRSLFDKLDLYDKKPLIEGWSQGKPGAVEKIEKLLSDRGVTMDAVMAETLSISLEKIERFDNAIAKAEFRRNAAQREIERRRSAFAQSLIRTMEHIEHDALLAVEDNRTA